MKAFELERVTTTFEEAMADFRKLKAEHEAELEKNKV